MSFSDAGRCWRTLRHLAPGQIAWLVARRVLRWRQRVALSGAASLRSRTTSITPVPPPRPTYLGDNRFSFLNHARDFGSHIDWSATGESRLWQYHLHYFDWLRQNDIEDGVALAQMLDWIGANPPFHDAGWEPYPVSLRLVNWSYAIARIAARESLPHEVIESYALQAAWLAANLEHDLKANHLFANAKALLFAGVMLDGTLAGRLLDTSVGLLERELDEQFLDDGGHFERSPMYHAILTADLLELADLVRTSPKRIPNMLAKKVDLKAACALDFALAMAMLDGTIALFNDAAHNIAPSAETLLQYARDMPGFSIPIYSGCAVRSLEASGYFVVRDDDAALVIDCGEIGPDYQPGHAHCDMLSFELAYGGQRIVTDTGIFDYEPSAERRYARSTRVHNTVDINGTEQSEIWGAFRVGRRARPIYAHLTAGPEGASFCGAHNGYHHLPGQVTHVREIEVGKSFSVRIHDRVEGGGTHHAVSRIHFAHGLEVAARGVCFEVRSAHGKQMAVIENIVAADVRLEQTDRYPEFGLRQRGTSLIMSLRGILPLQIECTIRKPV